MSTIILGSDKVVYLDVACDSVPVFKAQQAYSNYKDRETIRSNYPGDLLVVGVYIDPDTTQERWSMNVNKNKSGIQKQYPELGIKVEFSKMPCVACGGTCHVLMRTMQKVAYHHNCEFTDEMVALSTIFLDRWYPFCCTGCKDEFLLSPVLYV